MSNIFTFIYLLVIAAHHIHFFNQIECRNLLFEKSDELNFDNDVITYLTYLERHMQTNQKMARKYIDIDIIAYLFTKMFSQKQHHQNKKPEYWYLRQGR